MKKRKFIFITDKYEYEYSGIQNLNLFTPIVVSNPVPTNTIL